MPEGVYRIIGLNPNSSYHLSMKLDYPNSFDLRHAKHERRSRPGSNIFIHGKSGSVGCLAMGNEAIEELFVLVAAVGKDNARVVIAPHDPRNAPLSTSLPTAPSWLPELYGLIEAEFKAFVNDHPNGASDDRRNGANSKWPKSGFRTGSKRLIFTPFHFADLADFWHADLVVLGSDRGER